MTYAEKLRDPRWQKRRLEILSRDAWTCQFCGDKTRTLHVHHYRYHPNLEPWEYKDAELETLCEDCHSYVGDVVRRSAPKSCFEIIRTGRVCYFVNTFGEGDDLSTDKKELLITVLRFLELRGGDAFRDFASAVYSALPPEQVEPPEPEPQELEPPVSPEEAHRLFAEMAAQLKAAP
jgi:hypothetical protein